MNVTKQAPPAPKLDDMPSAEVLCVTTSRVPCGTALQAEWFAKDGALLRRDQTVFVTEGVASFGAAQL